ncbi:MAG: site-specific integrase [Pyrinomonadaceae bacterium MAG19_C2-C3]|nr:site-specific integrase [Pyrinomonadaceae bacterium MAG19_C2-C3]
MAKKRTGTQHKDKQGRWWAIVTYTDSSGRRRFVKRRASSKYDALDKTNGLLIEFKSGGERAMDGARLTFEELAESYRKKYVKPAHYVGEKKVSGLKSYVQVGANLDVVRNYFGSHLVRNIRPSNLDAFKQERLDAPTIHGKQRAVASVNRELETLRAVLNYACAEGYITRSPFTGAKGLIEKSHEVSREVVLARGDEVRLLAVCTGAREHLRPLAICAMDTGARRGELFKLTWRDVDFDAGVIRLRATTTKTNKRRTVGITERLREELLELARLAPDPVDGLVFGVTSTVKRSWKTACRLAGIEGVRFHDLRHTAITQMVETGMPQMEVMKISGHTQMATFARYVNPQDDNARRGAAALDAARKKFTDNAAGTEGGTVQESDTVN